MRRLGKCAMLVDEIRHLRESIDLIVMLTIRERDNFIGELGPVRSQLDAALANLIDMPIESSRFEPRGVIGTIRQRPFNFRLSWEISAGPLAVFSIRIAYAPWTFLNFRALRMRSSNSHCARY